jgi:hypothetical protein
MSEFELTEPPAALDHVRRPPLPWRDDKLTECGLAVVGRPTISRDEFVARVKQQGKQRSAMTTCMTCWHTAARWPTWDQDPVQAIARETYQGRRGDDHFRDELRAIAALIEAHRDEFDGYLHGLTQTVALDDRRAARRLRIAHQGGRGA